MKEGTFVRTYFGDYGHVVAEIGDRIVVEIEKVRGEYIVKERYTYRSDELTDLLAECQQIWRDYYAD